MRVISQDRFSSVDFGRTMFWMQSNIIYAKIGNADIVFGNYETEERTAEVFQDIHNAYAPVSINSTNLSEKNYIYYMPEV